MGIEWRKLLDSASGSLVQKQLDHPALAAIPGLSVLGKLLREDVDSLILASRTPAVKQPGRQSPMLVVVKGRFDPRAVRSWLRGKGEIYRNVEVLAPAGSQSPTARMALLDPSTLLFGDRREVLAALDRRAVPSKGRAGPLAQRATELAARYDFWMAANAPTTGFPAGAQGPEAQMLSQVRSFDMGMSFSSGVDIEASLQARSPEAARELATAVQSLIAMSSLEKGASPEAAEILRKMQVKETASGVSIALSLTEAEVARSLERAQAPTTVKSQPAPPPPQGPRKIRIIGMEGGPVEIPAGSPD